MNKSLLPPTGWISKKELFEWLAPTCPSDDQLKDWAKHHLIQRPYRGYKGHRGAQAFYAPDTVDRVRVILELLEQDRNYFAVRFRLWQRGATFPVNVIRETLARLVFSGSEKNEPLQLFEPNQIHEALEKASEYLARCRRELGATGLLTLLTKHFGSRKDANALIESVTANMLGAKVPLGTTNEGSITVGVKDIQESIASKTIVDEAVPALRDTRTFLNQLSSTGILSIQRIIDLMVEFDENDYLTMQIVLNFASVGWDNIIENFRVNVDANLAEFLNQEFNPNLHARGAAFLILLFAVMADIAETKFSDCSLSIAGMLLHLACHNMN